MLAPRDRAKYASADMVTAVIESVPMAVNLGVRMRKHQHEDGQGRRDDVRCELSNGRTRRNLRG